MAEGERDRRQKGQLGPSTTVQPLSTHMEKGNDSHSGPEATWVSHGGTHWTREQGRERKDGRMMLRFLVRQLRETAREHNNILVFY